MSTIPRTHSSKTTACLTSNLLVAIDPKTIYVKLFDGAGRWLDIGTWQPPVGHCAEDNAFRACDTRTKAQRARLDNRPERDPRPSAAERMEYRMEMSR